jgi:crotonobetainyl-CoA:carnitine CoA-transferase CaiB-like acyl-CoA transferase
MIPESTPQPERRCSGPLANIRVLDISTFLAAPMAATWLADFGADVVKVEHPRGDMMRSWGSSKEGIPLFWKVVGRNKRSIVLDLHLAEDQRTLKGLAAKADVVVENFRPGTLASWGLDYASLAEANPGLIMLSISAFGQTGPYRERAGFGTLAEAMSGYAYVTGQPDGPPTLPSFGLADSVTGLCGAYAVMMALHERDTVSGVGQSIDMAIYEPMIAMLGHHFIEYDQLGVVAERLGSRLPFAAPRNVFRTGDDKWIAMSCSAQSVFERACAAIGQPGLTMDERFADNSARTRNHAAIDAIFAEWIRERSAEVVLATLNNAGAAAAPVYDVSEVFADPHFVARENMVRVEDPDLGAIRMQNVVPRLSRTPGSIKYAGRGLGADTYEVFADWLPISTEEADSSRGALDAR